MAKISDITLVELFQKTTPGEWAVASGDDLKFHIYVVGSSPIKYVLREIPEEVSNYDLRLMSIVRQLAREVLEYRVKERKQIDRS